MKKLVAIYLFAVVFITLNADTKNIENKQQETGVAKSEKRIFVPAKTASSYSRLCEKSDMIGFWKVVKWTPYFHISVKDWNKPAFMKFQWYIFSDNGEMTTLSSQKEFATAEVEKKIKESNISSLFKFENRGFMKIINSEKKNSDECWRCAIATRNISDKKMNIDLEKGDVMMTLLSENDDVLLVKQLRKVGSDKSKEINQ